MNDLLLLKNQLCHRFYTVSNAFSRAYRPLLHQLNLTYPQYVVLMSLWENEGIAISDLVEHTRIDSGAMSLILKKLDSKGYITLAYTQHDRRVRIVSLTSYGRKIKAEAAAIPSQMRCHLSNISDDEARQLIHLIDKVSYALETPVADADASQDSAQAETG